MIKLADRVWIGQHNSFLNAGAVGVGALLNVAQDLCGLCGWPVFEYAQVGLIDGPGNPPSAYVAAVLTLAALVERRTVLVYCHGGSRSVAVVAAYTCMQSGRDWGDVMELLRERADVDLPLVNPAHHEAIRGINWYSIKAIMENK